MTRRYFTLAALLSPFTGIFRPKPVDTKVKGMWIDEDLAPLPADSVWRAVELVNPRADVCELFRLKMPGMIEACERVCAEIQP